MKIFYSLLFFTTVLSPIVYSQVGGSSIYTFLNSSSSARATALGGTIITDPGSDLALALENPAQLNEQMNGQISFQHQFIQLGIQSGYVGFGKFIPSKKIMTHGAIKYIGYGTFEQTDEFGNQIGEFKGNEVSLQLGASYQVYEKLHIGANVKFIQSSLDVYRSSGMALDLGALYIDTASNFTVGLVIKQMGSQLTSYEDTRENLPLNVLVGISKRLKHLPFRLSLTWHHLNKWNLLYDDPNSQEGGFFGGFQLLENEATKTDNFFRHIIFGGEMYLGKKELLSLRVGYNHQLKQELSVTNLRSLTGISLGFGFRVKKFQFDYATVRRHFGGSSHHLGLSTNLRYFTGNGIL
ncbi:MAG: type IX secretion system protein PorQ [Saprospiraceae bacterium]|nr:type IX secretion system protein PorQ [Saprospiraceae bacterium]